MPLRIQVTPRAASHIRKAAAWSKEHYANDLLDETLAHAFELLSAHPHMGAPAGNQRLVGVRRLLLRHIGYHLYYRVHEDSGCVEILAFWNTRRGSSPDLER